VTEAELNKALAEEMAACYADPLRHVLFSYPWGEGSLRGRDGPQEWQRQFLIDVGNEVGDRAFDGVHAVAPIRFSTRSGHGIGKSALVAWIIRWIMDTRSGARGVVTANTGEQLRTKTWSELAKWHHMGATKHWWTLNSGSGSLSMYHVDNRETWRVDGVTSRDENSEAFAGLHAASSTPFYIFDEASAISTAIFEVREGGLTDGEPMTFDFGNPTRNSGRFHENMEGRFRHNYRRRSIDSRTVEQTNKELFEQWAKDYGEDSDFFRVRVRGLPPLQGSLQFISSADVEACINLDVHVTETDPLIMGIDVARFGDDTSVIRLRHGRDAESPGVYRYKGVTTTHLASEASAIINYCNPDAVFVDGGGVGGGVIDYLRLLGHDVIEINFASRATQSGYANLRAQMWGNLRAAIKDGIRLEDDDDLKADLTNVEYGYNIRNEIQLEKKEDMKRRGLASPDDGDALALTYVLPVSKRARDGYKGTGSSAADADYDPFAPPA